MKKFRKATASLAVLVMTPLFASAQLPKGGVIDANGGAFGDLLINILGFSNNVLIPFILGIGFLVFVWGMFKFFIYGGADDEAKTSGKSLMVWATLGFVLIIVFWGVVNLIATSTGLDDDGGLDAVPSAQGITPRA
jgi:hypothetical protein